MCCSSIPGFLLMHVRHHLVPEHAGLHDVALLGRVHLVAALAGQIEGDADDTLDLAGGVDGGIDGALLAVLQRHDLLGLAEISAARQLAQDQDVEPLDMLAPERGGLRQRRIADGRAQVGEQVQLLAQLQQAGLGAQFSYFTLSHLGPPTEPNTMASAFRAFASVSSASGMPCLSMAAPPTYRSRS